MKIGIDISQMAYEQTGVANYLKQLVTAMLSEDTANEYILFYSSLRLSLPEDTFKLSPKHAPYKIVRKRIPPKALSTLWNKLHKVSIESMIGDVDFFISSDWTEPPTKRAKKATIIYDMIVYKHPEETDQMIIDTQKRKLHWVKKETEHIFAISEATKKDIIEILKIPAEKISVIYPGLSY